MQLKSGIHLAYCTNIHPGETWAETLNSLNCYTLRIRDRVAPGKPFAIGLRLSNAASLELLQPPAMKEFLAWLHRHRCYVFTINGFPFGQFHGSRVKEQVYQPDWSTPERLDYTKRLFTILAELMAVAPEDCEGSVSTLPGSFKPFNLSEGGRRAIRNNLWECVDYIEELSSRTGREFHLGLEPEPLGLFETTSETIAFFNEFAAERVGNERWRRRLGVNYDVCHLACEYEEPLQSLAAFQANGIRISKIHLSSALIVKPSQGVREALHSFADNVYLHQVIARRGETLQRYRDLPDALAVSESPEDDEWRIHFHVPLLWTGDGTLCGTTSADNQQVLQAVACNPQLCRHLEMETYTWGVLPESIRNRDVVDQIAAEYSWCFEQLERLQML